MGESRSFPEANLSVAQPEGGPTFRGKKSITEVWFIRVLFQLTAEDQTVQLTFERESMGIWRILSGPVTGNQRAP